jgi:hypothetical protein
MCNCRATIYFKTLHYFLTIKNNSMHITKLLSAVLSLFFYGSINAQYTIPPVTGAECTRITDAQLRVYLNKLNALMALANQDKTTYGTTGNHPLEATYFYDVSKIAHDSLRSVLNRMATGGDGNPAVTIYSEAGTIWDQLRRHVINNLLLAHAYAQISATYNNSRYASCGREETLRLVAEGINILTYCSRCYIGPYSKVPPAVCK